MDNLKKLRLSKNMSQQALADQLNTSQQSIYKYENHLTEPNIEMLTTMADFFNVSVDYLIGYSSCPRKIEPVQEMDLNTSEMSLIRKYRLLPATTKIVLQELINEFLQEQST